MTRKIIVLMIFLTIVFGRNYFLGKYYFNTAMEQYQTGFIQSAAETFVDAANHNNCDAYAMLGKMELDKNTHESHTLAHAYLLKSVELGSNMGYAYLGDMYLVGYIVKKDHEIAVQYFKKGIEANDPVSMNYYAIHLTQTSPDSPEIIELMQKSAQLGYKSAQWNVGVGYFDGNYELKCDPTKSANLLFKAVQQKFPPAYFYCGRNFQYGYGVEQDMKKAAEFYKKSLRINFIPTIYELAQIRKLHPEYLAGIDMDKETEKAYSEALGIAMTINTKKYFQPLLVHAANLLESGIGGHANQKASNKIMEKVIVQFKKNIERNHPFSYFHYGLFLIKQPDEQEVTQGKDYIKKAADMNFPPAKKWLTENKI